MLHCACVGNLVLSLLASVVSLSLSLLQVRKRPGKEGEDVLEGGGEEEQTGFWGK